MTFALWRVRVDCALCTQCVRGLGPVIVAMGVLRLLAGDCRLWGDVVSLAGALAWLCAWLGQGNYLLLTAKAKSLVAPLEPLWERF